MHLSRLGPFRLERLIGRGGMGAVYVGVHEETGQRAAIKLLSAHLADDESFRDRFKQEIDALKRLLHANIVQLFGYGEEEGHLYFVMELVEGRSLQDELASGRRFEWREVARIGIAIAQALKHAHDRGIIHRDLKPANLLIDTQDHIKLTDFGIAKLYGGSHVTVEGGVLGTADYMAPEQSHGEQVTTRCDLYALGSVMYALLTGKPPFMGKSLAEVVTALQKEKPVNVRRLAPDTPEEFERIVMQLLEKHPDQRIPTAVAVANRLKAMERALSLETQIDPPPPASEPAGPTEIERHSAMTQAADLAGQQTAPLPPPKDDQDEYRLAADEPTRVTQASGSAAPSDRTALATQASKKTGAGAAGGTHPSRTKTPAVPPAPKLSQFIPVSEEELRGRRETEDSPLKQWGIAVALAGIGLAVIGGAILLAMQRPSADRLYRAIQAAAAGESPGELAAVESQMASFLDGYPDDPRREEVTALQEKLAAYRLERKSVSRSLRQEIGGGSPVELAYREALRVAADDPSAGLARFEAIVAVFDDTGGTSLSETDQQFIKLAKQQAEKLAGQAQRLKQEQRQLLKQQLERARDLAAEDRPAAEAIWRGIITLYEEKDWATDLVQEARQSLN